MKQFEKIAEVQSDKANVEITSRYDGVIKKLHYGVGEVARVGAPLVDIEVEGEEAEAASHGVTATNTGEQLVQAAEEYRDEVVTTSVSNDPVSVKALPSVRKKAKELGINLASVTASGKQGQVTMEDLLSTSKAPSKSPNSSTVTVPLNVFQKAMVRSMTESIKIPHFGFHDEIAIDRLQSVRSELNMARADKDKLTPLPFIIKAMSMALNDYPQLNAHFNSEKGHLTLYPEHNIGVAVDTGHGLAVPVIKNVAAKTVTQIAKELNRLTELSRANKLSQADLSGATLTISNIGTIGGTTASPIIPHPQLAIVALGRAQKAPRFDALGKVVPVSLMPVSWSADHRVVDGATIARFSQRWRQLLENPSLLLDH